jgi:hypothetical protein
LAAESVAAALPASPLFSEKLPTPEADAAGSLYLKPALPATFQHGWIPQIWPPRWMESPPTSVSASR